MIDYSKYENATPKQIIHALTLAEKRAEKLNLQVKENDAFFNFLQKKLKKSFSAKKGKRVKKQYDEPTEETKKALDNDKIVGKFSSYEDFEKSLSNENNE